MLANNIIYNSSAGNACTGGGCSSSTRANNLWYGPNIPACVATEICGKDPMFTNLSANDLSLQASSPAISVGTNLGVSYNQYPLPGATWPNPPLGTQLGIGNWDLGAVDGATSTANRPAAPTGVIASAK